MAGGGDSGRIVEKEEKQDNGDSRKCCRIVSKRTASACMQAKKPTGL